MLTKGTLARTPRRRGAPHAVELPPRAREVYFAFRSPGVAWLRRASGARPKVEAVPVPPSDSLLPLAGEFQPGPKAPSARPSILQRQRAVMLAPPRRRARGRGRSSWSGCGPAGSADSRLRPDACPSSSPPRPPAPAAAPARCRPPWPTAFSIRFTTACCSSATSPSAR